MNLNSKVKDERQRTEGKTERTRGRESTGEEVGRRGRERKRVRGRGFPRNLGDLGRNVRGEGGVQAEEGQEERQEGGRGRRHPGVTLHMADRPPVQLRL